MLGQDEIKRVLDNYTLQLQQLKTQQTKKGLDADPDLQQKIKHIQAKIEELLVELDRAPAIAGRPSSATIVLSSQGFAERRRSSAGPVIQPAWNILLDPAEEAVLRRMFNTCDRVALESEFGGGLSGGRVFKVWPIEAGGKAPLVTVVKIGPFGLIRQEVQAYKAWVENSLPRTAARLGAWRTLAPDKPLAGLSYELVGSGIFNVQSLGEYYEQASTDDLIWVLKERLCPIMGRLWWLDNKTERAFQIQADYDGLLPLNLSITFTAPFTSEPAHRLRPGKLPRRPISAGEFIQLQEFTVIEVDLEGNRLTLNLPRVSGDRRPVSYRLRVEQVPHIDRYQVGQAIDTMQGVVAHTRHDLLVGLANQALGGTVDLSQPTLGLPGDLTLPNPLLAYQEILNEFVEVNLSTIHGDLNLENILVDPNTRDVSLIDFATVRQGHALHDLLRLETEVITKLVPKILAAANLPAETIQGFYRQLHRLTFHSRPYHQADPAQADLDKPLAMLLAIRKEARKCLFNSDDASEYYRGLVIYLLGALKFKNLDAIPWAKAVAFWGAATLVELLKSSTVQTEAQPDPVRQQWGDPAKPTARRDQPQFAPQKEQLRQAIASLEAQRTVLGDVVVDASIATLREKLAALDLEIQPLEQQRKQATILFADVSGFTAMSEAMDVEDVNEIMNSLWNRLDKVITEHGGQIDKHIGDAVMAVWGVQTVREDDPERATRAALAMQETLASLVQASSEAGQGDTNRFSSQLPNLPVPLQMRIGLNTGPVLLGTVGTTGEYTAMGDTVNTASRLEKAAPVGGILISHDTYRHVRGMFDLSPQPPLRIKGKTNPVQTYIVQRAKPQTFRLDRRGIEGIETRMIGRQAELKQLQDALHGVVDDGERQVVTITGEAGIGKSRLLFEFDKWLELLPAEIHFFRGRARPETQNQPYALIRDLFIFRFQIQESDPVEVVRQKMELGMSETLGTAEEARMRAHMIGQLLGFDFGHSPFLQKVLNDAQQLRDRAHIYLGEYAKALAAQESTALFLEDIHWADDSSLDLLNYLALMTERQRLLIICTARPALFERRPYWGEGQPFHDRLELSPLSKRDCRRLVVEVLQNMKDIPDALRDLVVGRAEGNPFYVEELIKMLLDDGLIIKAEPNWQVALDRLAEARVPATLTGVLQARLDSLSPAERTTLQQAAVVGREFWDSVVARLCESTDRARPEPDLQEILDTLRAKEMVFRREFSAFAGTQEYVFKNAILREVTYESVLMRQRRVYHALIAEWLIEQTDSRADEYTGLIADHLALAGRTEQAVIYLRRAGEQAAAQFANAEAVAYFSRALELVPETDYAERYDLLLAREKILDLQGQRVAQARQLAALGLVAEALVDNRRLAEVALRQANYAAVTGDYPEAIAAAQGAVDMAHSSQAPEFEAAGYLHWGWALWSQGDYPSAQLRLERALSLAQAAQLRHVEADCRRYLGVVSYYQDHRETARTYLEQALNIWRMLGYRRGEGIVLNNLGNFCLRQGDYDEARAYYEQTLHIRREIGHRHGEGIVLNNLGDVCLRQGDFDGAQSYYEQSLHICREISDRHGQGFALNNLGRLALELGVYARAKAFFEEALQIRRRIGHRLGESIVLNNLGDVHLKLGDPSGAMSYYEQFLSICREVGDRHGEGYALTNLGHALADLDHLAQADSAYQRAIAIRRELDQPHLAIESLAGLARLSLARNELSRAQLQVEEILSFMEGGTDSSGQGYDLDDTDDPFWIYLTCYRALRAIQDSRVREVLNTAHKLLQERAAKISDDRLRRKFLENVRTHRDVIVACKAEGLVP